MLRTHFALHFSIFYLCNAGLHDSSADEAARLGVSSDSGADESCHQNLLQVSALPKAQPLLKSAEAAVGESQLKSTRLAAASKNVSNTSTLVERLEVRFADNRKPQGTPRLSFQQTFSQPAPALPTWTPPTVEDYRELEKKLGPHPSPEGAKELAGIGQILIVLYGSAWGQPVPDFGTHRADLQATVRMRSAIVSVAIILFCCILVSQEHRVVSSDEGEEEDDKAQKEAEDNDAFTSTLRKVSPEELGSHNEMGDLWMSVGGVVCDLSDFISVHPGGVELLMQHAGQEATDAFTEIGHSSFALKMIRERAIGVLDSNAEADEPRGVLQVPEAPSLLGRMFTKEDPYHFHKFLGISIVVQFLVRSGIVMNGEFMEGKDIAWFGPDYFSLACIWVSALLQFSSFKFHVPKNRILGAPMIWQEWRAHNAVFVLRHVIGCTIKWYAWHNQIVDGPMYHLLNVAMFATLVWQLWSVDVITAWLSEDKHESLTATYPFWRGCPSWVESFIKFWYTIAQFMASSLLVSMEPQSLAISYLVIFPFQWASFLMTLVRKGAITTRSYHVGYLWSLMQVVALGMLANSPGVWVTHFSLWVSMYWVRVVGLNKYCMWMGLFVAKYRSEPCFGFSTGQSMLLQIALFWLLSGLIQRIFTSGFEKRSRRYLESRTKPLVLVHREKVSDSLYWLRFQLPYGFTSGLSPGQHVRIHCLNPSKGKESWNGRHNLEGPATTLSRSYTPVNAPNSPVLDLLVRCYPPDASRGFPDGGRVSSYLTHEVQVGDQVAISGPHGHKVYHGQGLFLSGQSLVQARRCACMAGGSGITPALAVLRELRAEVTQGKAKPFVSDFSLLHVTRSLGEALPGLWYEPEDEAESAVPCHVAHFATSETLAAGKASGAQTPTRHEQLLKQCAVAFPEPADDLVILVCGPRQFVNDLCLPILRELGHKQVITLW